MDDWLHYEERTDAEQEWDNIKIQYGEEQKKVYGR